MRRRTRHGQDEPIGPSIVSDQTLQKSKHGVVAVPTGATRILSLPVSILVGSTIVGIMISAPKP